MNELSTVVTQTMSSLEIVKMINDYREEGVAVLRHTTFMAKVLKVLGEKDAQKFLLIYKDSMNREKPCYHLPKREANLMVMSESYKVQAAVYDRMVELETANAPTLSLPANYIQALEALVESEKEKLTLTEKIKREKPLVDFAVSVATSDGTLDIGAFAKIIGWGRNKLFARLRELGYLMDGGQSKKNLPYQEYMDRNYFEVVEEAFEAGGRKEIGLKTVITGKGQVVIEKRLRVA